MEFLFEILLQALGFLFEILVEFLLQVFFEAIVDLIGRSVAEAFRKPGPGNPRLAAVGYMLFGAIGAGISLLIMPRLYISVAWLSLLNLAVTPVLSGLLMSWVGYWRRKHDKQVIRLESFACGFCFAFAFAAVRYLSAAR